MNFSDIQKNYFEIFEISWKMPLIDAQSSICNYSKNWLHQIYFLWAFQEF